MIILKNGQYFFEPNLELESTEPEQEDPIKEFFSLLASDQTNSIAKIRQLAKDFLKKTDK